MTTLSALIQRWQAGDESAGEALYNDHRDRVFRLAYGLLGDAADAEEVAQDALAYALANIRRYDAARASFTTWLHTITVSRCRDRQRRKRLPWLSLVTWRQQGRASGAGDARSQDEPEAHAIQSEAKAEIGRAIQSLSPRLREAVLLRYWADHTFQEIAHIVGCPVPTAQSRVRLAYQQLRAFLSPTLLSELDEEPEQ
jgi:RNA polymerase sigma-70 factor (ECF subfamily)